LLDVDRVECEDSLVIDFDGAELWAFLLGLLLVLGSKLINFDCIYLAIGSCLVNDILVSALKLSINLIELVLDLQEDHLPLHMGVGLVCLHYLARLLIPLLSPCEKVKVCCHVVILDLKG
jgi:hypothetical protein